MSCGRAAQRWSAIAARCRPLRKVVQCPSMAESHFRKRLCIWRTQGLGRIRLKFHVSVSDETNRRALVTDAENQADERDRADMERLASGHDAALNELMER